MTPQELKNSILQLAIQGKLVEQRPEEGNAEELYQQIQVEKQRLIKTGTIKKENPLPEIAEDEKAFDIPESWIWVRIGLICNIVNGFTPLRSNPEFWDGDIPWFTIDDVRDQGRFINYTRQLISKVALAKNTERIVPADTVLLCCTASVGEYAYTNISLTTNQQFNALVVRNEYKHIIDPMFIFEFVQTLKSSLISKAGKTTFNFLSVGKLAEMTVPLPPLAEQKRIVAKIEELLPYIDRYEQAWSKLEEFNKRFPTDMQKSILQMAIQGKLVEQRPEEGTGEELYHQIQTEKQRLIQAGAIRKEKPLPEITEDEKPFDIPEKWTWVRLSDICNVSDGTHQTPTYVERGMPFISAQNVKPYRFIPQNYRCVSEADYEIYNKNIAPGKGDILMTRVGAGIGEAAIIDVDMCFSIYVSLTLIKCYKNDYDMKYLLYVLNSPLGRQLAKKKTLGKGASQGNLNLIFIREFLLPLPPLAEQKRIVAKLEELLPMCEKLKK